MHSEYTFESHYLPINGHRLHYIDVGKGPVVVMIHGNPTWSFYFRRLITLLAQNNRVIALDHMGCGLSDKPQDYDYSLKTHINNLTILLGHIGVEKASMIVHDWGGAIGMGYAVQYPQLIEKIVLLNTAAFRSDRIPFRIRICRWPIIGQMIVRGFNGFAWPATFMAVVRPLRKDLKKMFLLPYDSWKNRIAVYKFVRDIPLSPAHPSFATLVDIEHGLARLEEAAIPILILWGGKDFCFDNSFYQEWQRRFPRAEAHYFKEKGHYILEDGFDDLIPYFNNFFYQEGEETA